MNFKYIVLENNKPIAMFTKSKDAKWYVKCSKVVVNLPTKGNLIEFKIIKIGQ